MLSPIERWRRAAGWLRSTPPGRSRMNLKGASHISYPLAHASHADAEKPRTGVETDQYFRRYAPSFIADFHTHGIGVQADSNEGCQTSGVPVNIGQTLLHHAEQCGFNLNRQSSQSFRNIDVNADPAAPAKTLDIPGDRRFESCFIEQRGVQQGRTSF